MEDLVNIKFDFWSALLAFGIFQGLFLTVVLVSYNKNKSIYFLISLLLIIVLNLLNYVLLDSNLFLKFPQLIHLATPLLFLIGPIYYWYIKLIINDNFRIEWNFLWHFIPFLIAILFLMPFYTISSELKIELLSADQKTKLIPLTLPLFIFIASQVLQSFLYIYFSFIILNKSVAFNTTNQPKNKIIWLKRFSLAFLLYWAVDFLALLWYSLKGVIQQEVFYVTTLCNTVAINVLVFFAIRNNKEFTQILLQNWNEKYRNSALSKNESQLYKERILNFMKEEKPYLDAELTLPKLANLLDINSHIVSQILNLELGRSFYEFINEYRFHEVKQRLQESKNKHFTFLAIAFDSGFNNKNTFNKVFKKYAGVTPSQFLQKTSQLNHDQ